MLLAALVLLLTQLVAVPAPDGGAIETDATLRPGLELLAGLDQGRPLVEAYADGGVRLAVAPVAELGRLALYGPRRRTVTLAAEATRMPPGTVATLLAHEATHVQRYLDGRLAENIRTLGRVEACYAEELRASLVELMIWQTLHSPAGKPAPEYDYEDWLNVELAAVQRDPDRYPADVREWYADLCEPAGSHR
jgi:hypothetical protein